MLLKQDDTPVAAQIGTAHMKERGSLISIDFKNHSQTAKKNQLAHHFQGHSVASTTTNNEMRRAIAHRVLKQSGSSCGARWGLQGSEQWP